MQPRSRTNAPAPPSIFEIGHPESVSPPRGSSPPVHGDFNVQEYLQRKSKAASQLEAREQNQQQQHGELAGLVVLGVN